MTKSFDLSGSGRRVGVGQDGDAVGPFRPARRRLGDAVVLRAQELIDLHRLEPGGVRILQILDDPEPAAVVERHANRLANLRLACYQADLETVGHGHAADGVTGGEPARQREYRCDGGEAKGSDETTKHCQLPPRCPFMGIPTAASVRSVSAVESYQRRIRPPVRTAPPKSTAGADESLGQSRRPATPAGLQFGRRASEYRSAGSSIPFM